MKTTAFNRFFLISLFLSLPALSASIAESLADYKSYLFEQDAGGTSDSNFSGAVFNSNTRTLYIVDDKTCNIHEFTERGGLIRTVSTKGFNHLEGISRYKGDHYFLAEEDPTSSDIAFVMIPSTGSGPVHRKDGWVDTLAVDWGNDGLEAVSYRAYDNVIFAGKQQKPSRLYRISLNNSTMPDSIFENQPFDAYKINNDISDIYALADGNFLIVNAKSLVLVGYDRDGNNLSQLSLSAMTKPEGLAVDETDGTIYVVGEKREFSVFKRTTAVRSETEESRSSSISLRGEIRSRAVRCRFFLPRSMPVSIEFFLTDGKRIAVFERNGVGGPNEFYFPVDRGSAGLKLCRIKADGLQFTAKLSYVP